MNQFPNQYEDQRRKEAEKEVSEEHSRSSSRQNTIKSSITGSVSTATWVFACSTIGFLIGFFICCTECNNGASDDTPLIVWFALWIGGAILGAVLAKVINSGHDSSEKSAEKELKNEQTRCEKAVEEINEQAEHDIATYKKEFETKAKQMSVKYAESTLATEVIEWMTSGFARTIDAADRRSHIEKINVPFRFDVHTNKITCNLGTYDFKLKRCANLTSPLEQAALARAIATAIQLNITMKYPKDASGSAFVLNISYDYESNYSEGWVTVSVIYTAPNGNYRSVQSW
jgi:hypothetical protein